MYSLLHEVTHLEVNIISYICVFEQGWGWWVMVFNATFNNISAMTCRSELLVEETGVPGEKHIPAACHWQTLSHNAVSSYLNMEMTIVFIVVLHLAVIVLVCFFLSFKCSCIEDRLIFLTKYHVKQKGTTHTLIYLALSTYKW